MEITLDFSLICIQSIKNFVNFFFIVFLPNISTAIPRLRAHLGQDLIFYHVNYYIDFSPLPYHQYFFYFYFQPEIYYPHGTWDGWFKD